MKDNNQFLERENDTLQKENDKLNRIINSKLNLLKQLFK